MVGGPTGRLCFLRRRPLGARLYGVLKGRNLGERKRLEEQHAFFTVLESIRP